MMSQMLTPTPNQPVVLACTCNLSTQQVKVKRSAQDIFSYIGSSSPAQDTWDHVSKKQKAKGMNGVGKKAGGGGEEGGWRALNKDHCLTGYLFVSYLNTLLLLLLVWRDYSTGTTSIIPNHRNAMKCLCSCIIQFIIKPGQVAHL